MELDLYDELGIDDSLFSSSNSDDENRISWTQPPGEEIEDERFLNFSPIERKHELLAAVSRLSDNTNQRLKELQEDFVQPDLETDRKMQATSDVWLEYFIVNRSWLKEIVPTVLDANTDRSVSLCIGAHVFLEYARLMFVIGAPKVNSVLNKTEGQRPDRELSFWESVTFISSKDLPVWMSDWNAIPREIEEESEIDEGDGNVVEMQSLPGNEEEEEDDDDYEVIPQIARLPPEKRVLEYSQREIMFCMAYLSQRIKYYSDSEFIDMFMNAILVRVGMLLASKYSPKILDMPNYREERMVPVDDDTGISTESSEENPTETEKICIVNRNFVFYVYFYCEPILSRIFYHNLFRNNTFNLQLEDKDKSMVLEWIRKKVIPSIGQDSVGDRWTEMLRDLYTFEGDRDIFLQLYPNKPDKIVTILNTLRPIVAEDYLSQIEVSDENILNSIENRIEGNLFLFYALSAYFHSNVIKDYDWKKHFVLNRVTFDQQISRLEDGTSIELLVSEERDRDPNEERFDFPLIVEAMGNYGIWFRNAYWEGKTPLDALVAWMVLVDRFKIYSMAGINIKKNVLDSCFRPIRTYDQMGAGLYDKSLK